MGKQAVQVFGVVALVGALLTLLVAFWPVTAYGVSCGNVVASSDAAAVADISGAMHADATGQTLTSLSPVQDACSSATSSRRLGAGMLLIVTLVCGGVAVRNRGSVNPAAA